MAAVERGIPGYLVDFWFRYGFGSYRNGYFWMCRPDAYKDVVDHLFHNDVYIDAKGLSMIGYTSKNQLMIFDRRGSIIHVDLNLSLAKVTHPDYFIHELEKRQMTGEERVDFTMTSWLADDFGLHDHARNAHGDLNEGETFGYFPALQMGVSDDLDHLKKVSAIDHWSIIIQLRPINIYRCMRV